jgi:hypothetical protein
MTIAATEEGIAQGESQKVGTTGAGTLKLALLDERIAVYKLPFAQSFQPFQFWVVSGHSIP